MFMRVISCVATATVLLFSTTLYAQLATDVTATKTAEIQKSATTPAKDDEPDIYESTSSVKLATATLTALHRIHLSKEDRELVDRIAEVAVKNNQDLVRKGNPSPSDFAEARQSAEDVCREFSKVLTGKLRGIETGTTGWELLSSLATGVGIGTTVIGSARVAALVAGGSTAWGKTYGKPDTEHGADGLRAARIAISEVRLEFGRLSDTSYDKWLDTKNLQDKTKLKKIFSAVTASFINTCKG